MDREFTDNMIAEQEFDLGKTFDIEVTKRDDSNNGETNSTSSSGGNRLSSFGLGRTASSTARRSGSEGRNALKRYDSLSDTDYDGEDKIERQIARLKMVDLTPADGTK